MGRGLCPWEAPRCLSLQWDLVCEQKSLNRATSTFFFVGVLVGAVAFGYLSDRWGEVGLIREWGGEPSPTSWGLGLVDLCLGTSLCRELTLHNPCVGLGGAVCCWWPM